MAGVVPRKCAHRHTGGAVAGSSPREGACKPRSMVGSSAAPQGAEGSEAYPAQGSAPKRRKRRARTRRQSSAPAHIPRGPLVADAAPRPCAHRRTGGAVAGSSPRKGACKPRSMVGSSAAPRGAEGSEADPAQGSAPKRRKRRERTRRQSIVSVPLKKGHAQPMVHPDDKAKTFY